MSIFNKRERDFIKQLQKKNEDVNKEISKEIDELFVDLREEYYDIENLENDFSDLVDKLKSKLSLEEATKLVEFSTKIHKLNRTAQKGIDAMRELARDQKKATRETLREYESYLHT